MRKFLGLALSVSMLMSAVPAVTVSAANSTETISYTYSAGEGKTYTREMEKLGRGLVAVKTNNSVFLSWRLLDCEDARFGSAKKNVSFNIYRGNQKIAEVSDTTNYTDTTAGTSYSVAPVIDGKEGEKCEAVSVKNNSYFDIPLVKPEPETVYDNNGNVVYNNISFSPADCSTGDLDGDGEYEIIIKWTSSEHDVGSPGSPSYSGTVRFAAYKLDGTKLWDNDINLGKNVYSSAHTVQFLVYDFDGDGKAEMMCQTSLGSKDAAGKYVSNSASPDTAEDIYNISDDENENADFRNAGWGLITTGQEFLTIFNGETGEAIDTIDLPTARGNVMDWGDANNTAGNRVNRFVANVAYLDGEKPYAVYLRGYYFGKDNNGRQRTSIAGISFDGERLSPDYRFDTKSGQPGYYEGAYQYVGQGNHNCTVADVDNDGKDEFITGALCMEVKDDNSFKPRWCTYLQHGDALHIGDYDPTHNGFEFFTVHEDNGVNKLGPVPVTMDFGMSVIDADTGKIMFHKGNTGDTGRGVMANTGSGGYYQITGAGSYQCSGGTSFTATNNGAGSNFRIFWDGDLCDELLDGVNLTNWNSSKKTMEREVLPTNTQFYAINGTKANPALQADLFGDWREEIIYPTSDGNNLRVFTTTTPTSYKIKTLMHDPVYRSGVAAEQTAYNQPPHVGMYLSEDLFGAEAIKLEIIAAPAKTIYVLGEQLDTTGLAVKATYDDDTSKNINSYSISGYDPTTAGKQTIKISFMKVKTEFEVEVKNIDRIVISSSPKDKNVYIGGSLNRTGLVVKAVYTDGTSNEVTGYALSYKAETAGETTAAVEYMGKTATFTINVLPTSIGALNGVYAADSTGSVQAIIPIGEYKDDFTIEHTVTINSMPANGDSDKNSTNGFFVRFMHPGDTTHTGGGWYLTANGEKANVYWKSGASRNNATAIAAGSAALSLGKTYTFRYEFTNVGTGNGASLKLSVIDSNGKIIAEAGNLNVRNFSDTNTGKTASITAVEICNQAKSGSTSNVVFDSAKIYSPGSITNVDNKKITVNLPSSAGLKVYAAKYDGEILDQVNVFTPKSAGETVFTTDFEPDKVFLWADVMPIDFWNKNAE